LVRVRPPTPHLLLGPPPPPPHTPPPPPPHPLHVSVSVHGDAQIHTNLWEFDDGELAEGESVTHSYTEEGTYHVTLTVMDDNGEMGFSEALEVTVD
jgi:hypothetical protein